MVLGLMQALLSKLKLGLAGCKLSQLLPLLLTGGLLGQGVGTVQVSQLDGQVKFMFSIWKIIDQQNIYTSFPNYLS